MDSSKSDSLRTESAEEIGERNGRQGAQRTATETYQSDRRGSEHCATQQTVRADIYSALSKVYLIGAGPGAADLITVRGARLLAQADAVLYDALVTPEMLELCPQAVQISVGKRCGQKSATQLFINRLLVNTARQYPLVVRLKGGDPMLFGRADEELCALEAAGIAYEIVPGITAALAAASAVGLPLTKRGVSRSVAFFTSSTAPDEQEQTSLPDCDTLVQYMGGREATLTAERLLAQGRDPNTPVVVIENVSRTDQRVQHLDLATLQQGLPTAAGPVLVMVGEALCQRAAHVQPEEIPAVAQQPGVKAKYA